MAEVATTVALNPSRHEGNDPPFARGLRNPLLVEEWSGRFSYEVGCTQRNLLFDNRLQGGPPCNTEPVRACGISKNGVEVAAVAEKIMESRTRRVGNRPSLSECSRHLAFDQKPARFPSLFSP